MVAAPVAHVGQGVLGVHADVREIADGLAVEERAQSVLDIVAVEVRFHVQQQAGLHGHAAAAEPVLVEIVQGVAVLVGEIEVVLVILDDPGGLVRTSDRARAVMSRWRAPSRVSQIQPKLRPRRWTWEGMFGTAVPSRRRTTGERVRRPARKLASSAL